MDDKRIHKIVVMKHGNQYSVTGIKPINKKHLDKSGDSITKQTYIRQILRNKPTNAK